MCILAYFYYNQSLKYGNDVLGWYTEYDLNATLLLLQIKEYIQIFEDDGEGGKWFQLFKVKVNEK